MQTKIPRKEKDNTRLEGTCRQLFVQSTDTMTSYLIICGGTVKINKKIQDAVPMVTSKSLEFEN